MEPKDPSIVYPQPPKRPPARSRIEPGTIQWSPAWPQTAKVKAALARLQELGSPPRSAHAKYCTMSFKIPVSNLKAGAHTLQLLQSKTRSERRILCMITCGWRCRERQLSQKSSRIPK